MIDNQFPRLEPGDSSMFFFGMISSSLVLSLLKLSNLVWESKIKK